MELDELRALLDGLEIPTEVFSRLILEGVEFFTFSAEPVLVPGTVIPGYALRLT